jgi:hypothetical protein
LVFSSALRAVSRAKGIQLQFEAGNSSSVYGPFEAGGGCVRARFGQAAPHPTVSQPESFSSVLHSKERPHASRLSVYFQAAQKGMR